MTEKAAYEAVSLYHWNNHRRRNNSPGKYTILEFAMEITHNLIY